MDPATFSGHWADPGKVTNNQSQHSGKSSFAPFQHGTLPPWLKGYEGGARAPERRPGWAGKKWPDPLTPVVTAPADLPSGPPVGQMALGKEIGRGWDGVVREATDHDSPPKGRLAASTLSISPHEWAELFVHLGNLNRKARLRACMNALLFKSWQPTTARRPTGRLIVKSPSLPVNRKVLLW